MNATKKLWICSNDPEVCGFLTNDLNGNKDKLSISKCPDCHDGYLIVKPIKNKDLATKGDRMLGCTNYKKDGTGCNFSMYGHNYTQDKSKILVDEKGRVQRSYLKADINKMLDSIDKIYSKYTSFRFSYKCLVNFLSGIEDRTIVAFKLQSEEGYGMFKDKKLFFITKVIGSLYDLDVLEKYKNEKGYENIKLNQNTLTDNQVFALEDILF